MTIILTRLKLFSIDGQKWPLKDNNKAIKQAWIDAMQSNKEKDEQIRELQKEVKISYFPSEWF